jgi:hypothetical protein
MQRRCAIVALFAAGLCFAADPIGAGKYSGKWEGTSGGSGEFLIKLTPAEDGKWSGEISFTLGGQEVKCTIKALTVDGSKVHAVYTFDLQGNDLESTVDGELSGKKLGGTYKTRTVGDGSAVDEGTWETTAST